LVVLGRVDGELSDELAGGGVGDAHVEVMHEDDHGVAAVFGAQADVVHAAVDAQSDLSAFVDGVVTDAVVAVVATAGAGFGSPVIRVRGGAPLG
jgi:hypothetical protein